MNEGMELEGRFTNADMLSAVMKRFCTERMSGTLTLRCGPDTSLFYYYRGRFSGSENPVRPLKLGRILLNRGIINRSELDEALAYQADFSPSTPLGKVLVHRSNITLESLREVVCIQLEEELSNILVCEDGFYDFEIKEPASDEEPPLLQEDAIEIIDSVFRKQDELRSIRETITDDSMVPFVVKMKYPSDRELLHLNKREWHILSLINGQSDVKCIASLSGFGTFETYKILNSLMSNLLIQFHPAREISRSLPQIDQPTQKPAKSRNGNSGSSSSTRWGSLLSRLRDESERPDDASVQELQFESPVSFLVEIANCVIDRLLTNADFIIDPSDEQLVEHYWRQTLMSYPRADLVTAKGNKLQSDSFDRYTKTLGISGAMRSIYLESVDALCAYLRTLYLVSAQRVGSKTARSQFVNVMEDIRQRSTISSSETFYFNEEAAKILE